MHGRLTIAKTSSYYDRINLFSKTMFLALGFSPISDGSTPPLGAAYVHSLLSEVEWEQRPSGNGDREAILVGAGL